MRPVEVLAPSNAFVKDHAPSARAKLGLVFVEGATMVEEALPGALGGNDRSMINRRHTSSR